MGSPASGCAGDTHSDGDTVFVKGPSAAPPESQRRSPFCPCYLSISFLNLCVGGLCLMVVLLSPEVTHCRLHLQKAFAVVIQVDCEGKD